MSARRAAPTYAQAAASYSALQRVEDIRIAARHLKEAGKLLSHAPNARAAVARALKSVEGAERHAELAPYRTERGAKSQRRPRQARPRLYLLVIEEDVEPGLAGPWRTEAERIAAARGHKAARGDRDGLYRVDVTPSGRVTVGAVRERPRAGEVHRGARRNGPKVR